MKIHYYLFLTCLAFNSCAYDDLSENVNVNDSIEAAVEFDETPDLDSLVNTIKETDIEKFTDKFDYSYFPKCNFSKVLVCDLEGNHYGGGAENVLRYKSNGVEITSEQVADFLQIINDTNSFGNTSAGCFEPSIGLIFYGENGQECAYLSLCLDCNNIYCNPCIKVREDKLNGFSLRARKKLRKIFTDWGFKPHVFTSFYDDEEDLIDYLKEENASHEDIKLRVADFNKDKLEEEDY